MNFVRRRELTGSNQYATKASVVINVHDKKMTPYKRMLLNLGSKVMLVFAHKIVLIIQSQDDRVIWWFWEPWGGLGETTF